jgi:uncharacterized DUF497 family protein
MRVDWDPANNAKNKIKHGIDFETAQLVFDDPHCVTFVERVVEAKRDGKRSARLKRSL